MRKLINSERGASTMELVVLIILVGLSFPALLALMSQLSDYHARNEVALHSAQLANSKMEEILAFKRSTANWNDTIDSFAGSENLAGGYTRTITITQLENYGSFGIDAYRVNESIAHHLMKSDYTLVLMLVNY